MVEKTLFINGKLEKIAHKLGVDKIRFKKLAEPHLIDNSSYAIVRDPEKCINCGQCAAVCPVGALTVKKNILEVQKNLDDPTKTCVVHMAPAVRVGIGEEFCLPSNEETTGKMVAALRSAEGKSKYHFIEVMTCPGGCVNGGGQPIDFNAYEKIERRTEGLYQADKALPRRKSQDNPSIIETYKKVLPEGPCGKKSSPPAPHQVC